MNAPKKRLLALVLKHTIPHSRHQDEALKMLDSHYERFAAEIKSVTCKECGSQNDCVRWTDKGVIVDTWGYTEFCPDEICYICDKQGWIGDIFVPRTSAKVPVDTAANSG